MRSRVDRQAGGGAVAAELLQLAGAGRQPGVQVVGGDAAPRSLGALVADRDQHHRPAVALDQPRGDDADHALVPVGRRQHVGAPLPPGLVARLDLLRRPAPGSPPPPPGGGGSAISSLRGQLAGALIVVGQQQLERDAGVPQPSGRVDARAEPEAEVARRRRGCGRCGRPPSAPAVPAWRCAPSAAARPAPARGSRPAAAPRRRRWPAPPGRGAGRARSRSRPQPRVQRLGQLQHHAGAAQLRERVVATAACRRAGSRAARRPGRWWSVTITSMPSSRARRHLGDGRDAAVDRQHQLHALAGQPLQRLGAHAVALLEAAGQVPADLGAQRSQHQDGQRGRADAVGVVVAVHADPLAAPRSRPRCGRRRPPCRPAAAGRDAGPSASQEARARRGIASGRGAPAPRPWCG